MNTLKALKKTNPKQFWMVVIIIIILTIMVLGGLAVGLYFAFAPKTTTDTPPDTPPDPSMISYMDNSLLLSSSTEAKPVNYMFITTQEGSSTKFNISNLVLYSNDVPLANTQYNMIYNTGNFNADSSSNSNIKSYDYATLASSTPSLVNFSDTALPYLAILLNGQNIINKYEYKSNTPLAVLFGNIASPGVKIYENPVDNANMTFLLATM